MDEGWSDFEMPSASSAAISDVGGSDDDDLKATPPVSDVALAPCHPVPGWRCLRLHPYTFRGGFARRPHDHPHIGGFGRRHQLHQPPPG